VNTIYQILNQIKGSLLPYDPRSTLGPVYFVAFPTSSLVESGFSWVTYLLPILHKHYDVKRDDLGLSLPTLQADIKKLASVHQA
jgi:hypothetical protein